MPTVLLIKQKDQEKYTFAEKRQAQRLLGEMTICLNKYLPDALDERRISLFERSKYRPDGEIGATVRASEVAVDDADDDDDRHASDDGRRQNQPAVLERARDDVTQEYRARVNRVVRVARTGPRRRPTGALLPACRYSHRRRGSRLTAAARRRHGRPLGRGTNAAATDTRRSTGEV